MRATDFDKYPEKRIEGFKAVQGWEAIRAGLREAVGEKGVLVAEFYPGIHREEVTRELGNLALPCSTQRPVPYQMRNIST